MAYADIYFGAWYGAWYGALLDEDYESAITLAWFIRINLILAGRG